MSKIQKNFVILIFLSSQLNAQLQVPEVLAREDTREEEKEQSSLPQPRYDQEGLENLYKRIVARYKEYEDEIESVSEDVKLKLEQRSPYAGLTYLMTLNEMQQKLQKKFQDIKDSGRIVTKDQFEMINSNFFISKEGSSVDLTRLWGYDYLKKKLTEKNMLNTYDVPDYVIVADDPNNIIISIYFGDFFPIPNQFINAKIYFKKIVGPKVGTSPLARISLGKASGIGYDDFSDPGNIIKSDENGKDYIIDLEAKSFDFFNFLVNSSTKQILGYARRRFMYINNLKSYSGNQFNIHLK